ncbi:hypothetical protein C4572_00080 [Candidatus Parcubacteria bacterium]|nr:MAG: hypothetical protein C4572_00080 [Candidatus Parcubacteria bacterium]
MNPNDRNNNEQENIQNDVSLGFEYQLNYLRDILTSHRTQLQTLDHRLSYILGGNGVILGVELYFVLSPNQCGGMLIPLIISLSLIAISSIIAVIGNLSGYFLARLGKKSKPSSSKFPGHVQKPDAEIFTEESFDSFKLMTKEDLLKKKFQEKIFFKKVISAKLRLLTWASLILIANFLTILVLIFTRYYCLPA